MRSKLWPYVVLYKDSLRMPIERWNTDIIYTYMYIMHVAGNKKMAEVKMNE